MDYGARFYSPLLGRFLSADTMVPGQGNPQAYNRYSYVNNSPLSHTDSSGHCLDDVCANNPTSRVIYTSLTYRKYNIIRKYSLKANIITEKFVSRVRTEAKRFKLPPQLLAATLYGEINSYNELDSLQDTSVAFAGYCGGMGGCKLGSMEWYYSIDGALMIWANLSFGPAKIKPGAVLDQYTTVPALMQAGVSVPSDATDAAIQSLNFDRSAQLAAAHLRGLADLRKGELPGSSISRESDMTKVDMQVVRVAYTEGLKKFRDLDPDKGLGFYQTTTYIVPGGRGEEASPWLDAFAELLGP